MLHDVYQLVAYLLCPVFGAQHIRYSEFIRAFSQKDLPAVAGNSVDVNRVTVVQGHKLQYVLKDTDTRMLSLAEGNCIH